MDEDFSADFSIEELKLAFSYHLVNQVLGADGVVAPQEFKFLHRTFPQDVLARSRFVTDGRFTRRWQEALGEALLQLPSLGVPERLSLVETLFHAALADDELTGEEAHILKRAARLLGLADRDYAALLEQLVTNEVPLETEG